MKAHNKETQAQMTLVKHLQFLKREMIVLNNLKANRIY